MTSPTLTTIKKPGDVRVFFGDVMSGLSDDTVGEQDNFILEYFDYSSGNCNISSLALALVDDLPFLEKRDQRRVMVHHLERSVGTGEGGDRDLSFEDLFFRCQNFQMHALVFEFGFSALHGVIIP